MWTSTREAPTAGKVERYVLFADGKPLSAGDVLALWQHDHAFREFFTDQLAKSSFSAFKWETPPITASSVGRDFECVLLNLPALERRPEPSAFAEQFAANSDSILSFPNLGGDAILIVPRPQAATSVYTHLASFLRGAPRSQIHDLWKTVGRVVAARAERTPVFLSTAGMGVAWLHVRLDSRPKYFGHASYARMAP